MSTEFIPVNELEEIFVAAATDPTQRPHFFRTLLESDVFFIAVHDELGVLIGKAMREGQEIVPIFSSLGRLENFMREIGVQEYKHDHGSGREILTILETAQVVLNPASHYRKNLSSPEIRGILDGSEMKSLKILAIEETDSLLISQPATYPQELVDDLKASFAFSKLVKTAYLGQIHQDNYQLPQLVICIETDEGYDPSEAMEIAKESLGEDEFITFLRFGNDPLSTYLSENTQPFFTRTEDTAS